MLFSITTPLLLSLSLFFLGTVTFLSSNHNAYTIVLAQLQNMTGTSLPGVNITSPPKGQQIPVIIDELNISGKSTDKPATDDCQVSVIVNDVKPYQPAKANGTTGGDNDYSKWSFTLSSNYTSIKEGVNKITARLSCFPNVVDNITKWFSINITGIATAESNNTITVLPPQPSPAINSSAQTEPRNNEPQRLESNPNGQQEAPLPDSNNGKKIGEEIESLKERIMEQVEESLREKGIEMNLR